MSILWVVYPPSFLWIYIIIMKPIRLSTFIIFSILLAVILIGFLMHHTWESFAINREGFYTDFTETGAYSTELFDQYSQNKSPVAKLTDNLYFDPVAKVIIEKFQNTLFMRRQDGTDLSYNISTSNSGSTPGMPVSLATTTATPVCRLCLAANGYEVVAIPLSTNSTFIHVMDLTNNHHVAAFHFNGIDINIFNYTNVKIVPRGQSSKGTRSTDVVFSGNLNDISPPSNITGQSLYADASYDASMGLVFLAGRVGIDMYRAYVKTGIDGWIKYETGSGSDTSSSTVTPSVLTAAPNVRRRRSFRRRSVTTLAPTDSYGEMAKTINFIKTMQSIFGSNNNNDTNNSSKYMLKTEVIPPVCPSCPSCSSANGVCTSCGGNGGGGTNTGGTRHRHGGLNGVTDIGRDAVSGTIGLGKDVTKGLIDVTKDAVGGTIGLGKDIIGGVGGAAKDAVGGTVGIGREIAGSTVGLGREIVGGVENVAKDAIGGTLGIGREILGGVGGLLRGGTDGGGHHNSYGGPQYNNNSQTNFRQNSMNNQQRVQPIQMNTPGGQDPYSYYGALQPRKGENNFIPRTADFSSFGR